MHRTTKEVIWVNLTPPRTNDDTASTRGVQRRGEETKSADPNDVGAKRMSESECADDVPKNERNGGDDEDKKGDDNQYAVHKSEQEKRTSTRKKNSPDRYAPS
jgi:hypothetical protein